MTYEEMRQDAREAAAKIERARLRKSLRMHGWSVQSAAEALEVSPSTLYRAIERHPELQEELAKNSPPPGRVPAPK